jgi:Ca2+-binding RTX toxin-like protein
LGYLVHRTSDGPASSTFTLAEPTECVAGGWLFGVFVSNILDATYSLSPDDPDWSLVGRLQSGAGAPRWPTSTFTRRRSSPPRPARTAPPPTPSPWRAARAVESPPADLLFKAGQQITLSGSATDSEDGQLQEESLKWEVLQHHTAPNSHTHPYFSGRGTNLTFQAPEPEDLASTGAGNYLEVRLTATDANGLSKTVTQEVQPNRVDVSFGTNPSSLSLQINGETFTVPKTLPSWEGYTLNVNAPSPQTLSGTTYVFSSWSDSGAQSHDIVTGPTPSTYMATFTATSQACTKTGTSNSETITGSSGADVICGRGGNDTIKGSGGNDTLLGEGGNDTLNGGTGDDTLKGGGGGDTVDSKDGVSGNDSLDGGAGTDTKVTDATEKSIVGFP